MAGFSSGVHLRRFAFLTFLGGGAHSLLHSMRMVFILAVSMSLDVRGVMDSYRAVSLFSVRLAYLSLSTVCQLVR